MTGISPAVVPTLSPPRNPVFCLLAHRPRIGAATMDCPRLSSLSLILRAKLGARSMPIQFTTSAVTVSQLFSGSHTYRMPEFQRPYSWPDDRAVQLFDDLESACVASASRASSAT